MGDVKTAVAEGETLDIFNASLSKLSTSKGDLRVGQSLRLPTIEAKKCLKYFGIRLTSDVAPAQADEAVALKKENAELRKQVADLQDKLKAMPPVEPETAAETPAPEAPEGEVRGDRKGGRKGSR